MLRGQYLDEPQGQRFAANFQPCSRAFPRRRLR